MSAITPDKSTERLAYVCVASEFNVAEYESCRLRLPTHLVLVVSENAKIAASARRLRRAIKKALPGIIVIQPHSDACRLEGNRLDNCLEWARTVLVPELDRLPSDTTRIVNITGGTKAMTWALLHDSLGMEWDAVDYKPAGRDHLEIARVTDCAGPPQLDRRRVPAISPLEVLDLYSETVSRPAASTLADNARALSVAERMYEGLVQGNSALLKLLAGFERHWFLSGERQVEPEISASIFLADERPFDAEELDWLKQWQELIEPTVLQASADRIRLPGVGRLKGMEKQCKGWLCGDWLEQLVFHWISDSLPLDERAVRLARNIRVNNQPDGQSHSERETDILLHYRGMTTVIEVKADLPLGKGREREVTRQVSSLADRLGKTGKILFCGPQFIDRLKANDRLESFKLRCRADGVGFCHEQSSLLKLLRLPIDG